MEQSHYDHHAKHPHDTARVFTAAVWTVKPGREAEFAQAWKEFADWSAGNQPGALGARLLRQVEEQNVFISIGPWKGLDSVREWRKSDEFQKFYAKARELCDDIKPFTLEPAAAA